MSRRPEEPPYFVRKMDEDFQRRWHAADAAARERLEDAAYEEWDRKLGPPSVPSVEVDAAAGREPERTEKIEFVPVRPEDGIRPGEVRVNGRAIGVLRDFAAGSAEIFRQALSNVKQGEHRDQNEAEVEAQPQNRDEGEAGIDG